MAFSSHPKLLATLMDPVESLSTWGSRILNRRFYGRFWLFTEIFKRPLWTIIARNILVINVKNTTSQINKIVWNRISFEESNFYPEKTLWFHSTRQTSNLQPGAVTARQYKVMNMKFRFFFAKNFPHFSLRFRYFHGVSASGFLIVLLLLYCCGCSHTRIQAY